MQGFLLHFEAVAGELHTEGGGALGEVAVLDIPNGGAGQAADIHAAVFKKPGVFAGAQGFDEEVGDVLALYQLAAVAAGGGYFLALAIVESRAGGELGDLVHVEAHREHEVEEHKS